jgi:hypothetical protein
MAKFSKIAFWVTAGLTVIALYAKMDGAATAGMGAVAACIAAHTGGKYVRSKFYHRELDDNCPDNKKWEGGNSE